MLNMRICYNFTPGKQLISAWRQSLRIILNKLFHKFLCGIALAGIIFSMGFGSIGSMSVHARQAADPPYQLYLPLIARAPDVRSLTVAKIGTGGGTVTSDPAGIDCGSTCSHPFTFNSLVTLTATPAYPSIFVGWTGGGCSGFGTCQVTMNADLQVSAAFFRPNAPCYGINNCDFENGPDGKWTEYSLNAFDIIYDCSANFCGGGTTPIPPHSGTYLAWLGGFDYTGKEPYDYDISYIEQQISIYSYAPHLVYWQWIESEDFCGYDYDYTEVLINAAQVDKYDLCAAVNTGEWVPHHIDLTGYAGKSVTLKIRVTTDDSNVSNLYIDDVSLQATPEPPGSVRLVPPKQEPTDVRGKNRAEP
jgi:hypothetical protein